MNKNSIEIREANFNDEQQIIDLWKRNNLIQEDLKKNWKMIWSQNPAYIKGWPIGWVLESKLRIVGYLGNIPLNYYLADKKINTAVVRGFVVDAEARNHSLKLASSFFRQKNIDLFLVTTSNKIASYVYKVFNSHPLPCLYYKSIFYWIINSKLFITNELVNRFGFPFIISNFLSFIINPFFSLLLKILGHGNNKNFSKWNGQIEVISYKNINDDFDKLWLLKKKELSKTLLADRSAKVLQWHYQNLDEFDEEIQILTARSKNVLKGYMVLAKESLPNNLSLKRVRIIDFFVSQDSTEIIDALIAKAFTISKQFGVHSIFFVGLSKKIRARFMVAKPIVRKLDYMPFWFNASNPDLLSDLLKTDTWYPGHYDGDSSL